MNKLSYYDLETLKEARANYGNTNQILVAMEELNELAAALAKYPRYADHDRALEKLKDKVLDEYADVIIVLNHVKEIFSLTPEETIERVELKIERLRGWMIDNPSFEYTTVSRELTPKRFQDCGGCFYYDHWDDPKREYECNHCPKNV